jgi:hypothetical protein
MNLIISGVIKGVAAKSRLKMSLVILTAMPLFLFPSLSLAVEDLADPLSKQGNIAPWANNLKPGNIEVESEIDYSYFDHYIDGSGKQVSANGRHKQTELNFRVTSGITKRVEAGAVFGMETESFESRDRDDPDEYSTSVIDVSFAFRYRFWGENDSRALAVEAGVVFPMVSEASYALWEAGLVYSQPISKKLSMSADATYFIASETESGDPRMGTHANLSFCYFPVDKWMLAAELNGLFYDIKGGDTDTWEFTPSLGVQYELNDLLSFQLYGQQVIPGLAANDAMETRATLQITFAFGPKKQP